MNSMKWIVLGLCFLTVMAGASVWYVEAKFTQAATLVDGAIDKAYAPIKTGADKIVNPVFEGMGDAVAAPFNFAAWLLDGEE